MRHYNAHLNDNGFTSLELLVVVVFAGILAAISAPSFFALNQRTKVNQAVNAIQNSLVEAQRSAMRRGRDCVLTFTADTSPTITSTSGNCLSTDQTLNNVSILISTNNNSLVSITPTTTPTPELTFGFDGNVKAATNTTIVIQHKSNAGLKKCIVVSSPLGLVATGKYTGTNSNNISSNCTP